MGWFWYAFIFLWTWVLDLCQLPSFFPRHPCTSHCILSQQSYNPRQIPITGTNSKQTNKQTLSAKAARSGVAAVPHSAGAAPLGTTTCHGHLDEMSQQTASSGQQTAVDARIRCHQSALLLDVVFAGS
jgi:hypothetical protein